MHGVLVLGCGLLGLLIGSFLNVVIWRVPQKLSVVRPPSHCPQCETPIRPVDNVPVLSWLLLHGKCRHCGNPIAVRYPLVEAGCGVLFAAIAARFGSSWALPAYLVLTAALLAISIIDLEHFIVPDRITAPLTVSALALLGLAAVADGNGWRYGRTLLGGVAFFAFLLVLNLFYPRGMGMGDVKLSFSLAAVSPTSPASRTTRPAVPARAASATPRSAPSAFAPASPGHHPTRAYFGS